MSVFLVLTYDVTNPERFADYNPGSLPAIGATLQKHGGAVSFAGAPEFLGGESRHSAVSISFPDADAAKAWLDEPDYAEAKAIRLESTDNITMFIIDALG